MLALIATDPLRLHRQAQAKAGVLHGRGLGGPAAGNDPLRPRDDEVACDEREHDEAHDEQRPTAARRRLGARRRLLLGAGLEGLVVRLDQGSLLRRRAGRSGSGHSLAISPASARLTCSGKARMSIGFVM
jgi:hypothetical protein